MILRARRNPGLISTAGGVGGRGEAGVGTDEEAGEEDE